MIIIIIIHNYIHNYNNNNNNNNNNNKNKSHIYTICLFINTTIKYNFAENNRQNQ